ncbi:LicD family-domain-containing protein [Elsinoe ampelina]|uniref:LicD family-domain-containing protein n=1 Tax=Elsinoe ampelina TaxID=302913 RepID=A0A6A6GGY4_9PEZI|nr:LicD family-domain-containing protein [Elsinoe ampelina]
MRFSILSACLPILSLPVAHSLVLPPQASHSASHSVAPEALDVTPPTNTHEIITARTNLTGTDSNSDTDPPGKYFHEAHFHHHYDGRFAKSEVPYQDRRETLIALIRAYLATMNEIGAETWIMHGSLLGWWWNKRIMPWDTDLDVMISEQSADHLAKYYNMTVHHYKHEGWNIGRDYMLEMNPHYTNASVHDGLNKIDGRWVDMASGLFIDITVLHRDVEAQAAGVAGAMYCKDSHTYTMDTIFPLRESVFEDTPALIPYAYTEILMEEYGPNSLTNKDYEKHHFDQEVMDWIPIAKAEEKPAPEPGYEPPEPPAAVPSKLPDFPALPAPLGPGPAVPIS